MARDRRDREAIPVGRETDRDGDVTPAARREAVDDVVQQTTNVITPRDRVRWGPIWAGLLTALTTWLLLSLLALAIGALTVNTGAVDAESAGLGSAIASAIIGLIAFGLGGAVAAKTAAVGGRANGLLNGFLVWALGLALILILSALGLGQIFGALGNLVGNFQQLNAARAIPNNVNVDVNPQQIADNIANSAFGTFLALAIPAAAAAIGGLIGARKDDEGEVVNRHSAR